MTLKFYNTNLSFSLAKLEGKDNTGKNIYSKDNIYTNINYEQAYALYKACEDILNNTTQGEMELNITTFSGAVLTLKRIRNNNSFNTMLIITKENNIIPFYFTKIDQKVDNSTRSIEMGLGAFYKTIEGYLTGINADRHLDKFTEEFAKAGGNAQNNNSQQNFQQNKGNYNQGYQKKWNNNRNYNNNNYRNNNYRNNYNRNNNPGGYQKPSWEMPPQQQNFSEYQINQ